MSSITSPGCWNTLGTKCECVYTQFVFLLLKSCVLIPLPNACINLTINKQTKELDPTNPLYRNSSPTKAPSNLCDHHTSQKALIFENTICQSEEWLCGRGVQAICYLFTSDTSPLPKNYHNGHHNLGYINIIIYHIRVNEKPDHICI